MRNVAELEGTELDLWVSRAVGVDAALSDTYPNGSRGAVTYYGRDHDGFLSGRGYCPSRHWSDGGEIIERENIQISPPTSMVHRNGGPSAGWGPSGQWSATMFHKGQNGRRAIAWHETSPLTAAMRCLVAHYFGDTVTDDFAASQGVDRKGAGDA